jgi:hypothetical protein
MRRPNRWTWTCSLAALALVAVAQVGAAAAEPAARQPGVLVAGCGPVLPMVSPPQTQPGAILMGSALWLPQGSGEGASAAEPPGSTALRARSLVGAPPRSRKGGGRPPRFGDPRAP